MTELQTKFYDKIMEENEKFEEDVLKYSKQDIFDSAFRIVYFKEAHCLLRNMCEDGKLPDEIMEKALGIDDFTELLGNYMLDCDECGGDPIYDSWRYNLNSLWNNIFERVEDEDKIMKAINIQWDADGDDEILKTLPKEIEIPKYVEEDDIAGWIADETGFCVYDFDLEKDC